MRKNLWRFRPAGSLCCFAGHANSLGMLRKANPFRTTKALPAAVYGTVALPLLAMLWYAACHADSLRI